MADLLDRDITSTHRIRDVGKSFTLARAEENPFSTMIKKGAKPTNTLYEWPWKKRHTPSDNAVADGVDVASGEYINNNGNKQMLQGRVQKGRVAVGVSDMAEELGHTYAVNGGLLADNMTDGIILARENLEVTLLKNGDSEPNPDDANPMRLRGLTNWIRTANPGSPDLPVPADVLCAAGQVVTGKAAATDVTEDNVRAVMRTITSTLRSGGVWEVFLTPAMKEVFSNWSRTGDTTASTVPLRRFTTAMENKTISLDVQFYQGDHGKLRLHTHYSLPTGVHALFVRMDAVALRPVRTPVAKPLEYRGGGHKRIIEYIYGLEVCNPQAHGKITT